MDTARPKRKRTGTSISSLDSEQPSSSRTSLHGDMINPLSHTPNTLSQFLLAGLPDTEEIPARSHPDFPHRPWLDPLEVKKPRRRRKENSGKSRGRKSRRSASPSGSLRESSVDSNGFETFTATGDEDEEARLYEDEGPDTDASSTTQDSLSSLPKPKSYAAERAALRPLARSIAVFLSRDNVPAAKRAFGLLMRSRISGKPVDIRRNHYWELGAEILMRERPAGEKEEAGNENPQVDGGRNEYEYEGDDWATKREPGHGGAGSPNNDHRPSHGQTQKKKRQKQRPLYPFSNVPRVKAYFNDLSRRYPYHMSARTSASALQFQPAGFSYEIYQAHAQYQHSLSELVAESKTWADEDSLASGARQDEDTLGMGHGYRYGFDGQEAETDPGAMDMAQSPGGLRFEGNTLDHAASYPDGFGGEFPSGGFRPRATSPIAARETRLRRAKAEVRSQTLDTIRDIAERIDRLLEDLPFSRSTEMLRLAGIVWLYIADLSKGALAAKEYEEDDGQRRDLESKRDAALATAKRSFEKIDELGGEVDEAVRTALGMEQEDSEDEADDLPIFSSLPIRDHRPNS